MVLVNQEIARYGLTALDVDDAGLDEMDIRILNAIVHKFKGGPSRTDHRVATAVGEEPGTIEEVHEPFLIMEGYLQRTPRGRVATEKAYKHIGAVPPKAQGMLF
jgi:Holliday junction DNA helicase RuvB